MGRRTPRTERASRHHSDHGGGRERESPRDFVRVHLVSLGCAKNLIDSEAILGAAGAAGIAITPDPADAHLIVVNTCGFIGPARDESMDAIGQACRIKSLPGLRRSVVVVGCLVQHRSAEILARFPEVDAIVGLGQYASLPAMLLDLAAGTGDGNGNANGAGGARPRALVSDPTTACNAEVGRFRLTPPHYAYLRISEGCDNPCTFCSIPAIRGRFRSKPLAEIETEARELAASGAREIVLISQDTTSWGVDIHGAPSLPRVLERVASIDGVRWVRLLYTYPTTFTEETIDAIASIPQVLKYVDLPIQHIDDRMLRRMGRRMNEADTKRLLARLRERIPGVFLRTTFIVGFPGESDEAFGTLLSFVREFRFERAGVFVYSREDGTPAARLDGEVPEDVALARREELMLAQQEVAFAGNRARVGETCEAVIDGREAGEWFARSAGEAPEIDPRIILERGGKGGGKRRGGERCEPGRFLRIEITGAREYDLIGRSKDDEGD